jgi:leader peptidase (prepilin peptidase)/N-methyltransferase
MNPLSLFVAILAGTLGLVMGSAVTALSHRVPRGISWVRGRSACPSCAVPLEPRDLVPLFSWLIARGRCRHCGAPVSARYPLTELWCGAWGVALVTLRTPGWDTLPLAFWGFLLVTLFWIDLEFQLLPDALTFPGTLLGVVAALLSEGGARHAMFGMIAGAGLLWLLAEIWIRVRKIEGMGGGDIKLAAMFGAVLGWERALLTIFLAALAGSIWGLVLIRRDGGDGRTAIPFGSFLCPAAMIVLLWGDVWLGAYTRLLTGR